MSRGTQALLLVAVLATAFATNPEEESFRKYIEKSMKRAGSSWFERKVVSTVSTLAYKRVDYKFFSVITIPEDGLHYVGLFGLWLPLPTLQALKKEIDDSRRH
ncbi:uncharacterized protein BJ171DRAFT_166927 [Polychytrium aggregatum]|uniref:uncharacterized protein n=1 Tax=Polychytrium aggregatum TaxID=110093 RepID=UPI0022FEDFE0|nr:uncharacterized protein BJ171DRAFT_166927 [Polychytrium aggregatum]KAI9202775.1 hypothetical protein BJ171DRAFT_166927 [Polychytrium aggregatum]